MEEQRDRKDEIQNNVQELIEQTRIYKQAANVIKDLKQKILDYTDEFDLSDTSWAWYGSFVEVKTNTTYDLAEIPTDVKVPESVLPEKKAAVVLEPKMKLSREGKKAFKLGDPDLQRLMIPKLKKKISVILAEEPQ